MTKTNLVIGGGATGLVAAIGLARRGRAVTVLESSSVIGGRALSAVEEGFTFNVGAHALYANAERVLAELGVVVSGGVPTEGLTMQVGERAAVLPTGPISLLTNPALTWGQKWTLGRLLGRVNRIDAAALDSVSVADWLDREGFEGVARDVMLATVRVSTYVNAPDRMSAGVAVRQIRAALAGVRYLDGGWGTIVSGLAAKARELGVDIVTRARVASLDVQNGRAVAVALKDGTRLACDGVVLTLSPRACVRVLGPNTSRELSELALEATPVRAACLDVALTRLPRAHPSLILGTDRPIYVSVHSNVARLAPEGGALIHLAKYLSPHEKVSAETRRELESYLDMSQPGWREVLVEARWLPAATVMHAIPEASFGGYAGRPATDASGIPNVALAGDWVGPERLLFDACLSSALAAAESLDAQTRSMTVAMPMPPPMQSVMRAVASPRRSSSSRAVLSNIAPVAPRG